MATLTKIVHNVATGEIIERELNEQELAQNDIDLANSKARAAEKLKAEKAKAEILERLGINAEEAKLLLS